MRLQALTVTMAAAAVAGPTTAHAALVERSGSEIRFTAAPGEVNWAEAEVRPGIIRVHDLHRAVAVRAGAGCTVATDVQVQATAVDCPSDGVTHVRFDLGDGDDRHSAGFDTGSLSVQLLGGPGDDWLGARSGADLIDGGPGADEIHPGPGADLVLGGAGNDRVQDGDRDLDRIDGGDGDDDLQGSPHADLLVGGAGDDDLLGGDGDDVLDGGSGDDTLVGGRGADVLDAGEGEDDVDAGRGDDRLVTADAASEHSLQCGQGRDVLQADHRDAVNVDCEVFDGGRLRAGEAVLPSLTCPGGCASLSVTLTVGGTPITVGATGARTAAARRTSPKLRLSPRGKELLRRSGKLRVRALVRARDNEGRAHRSRGTYVLRRR